MSPVQVRRLLWTDASRPAFQYTAAALDELATLRSRDAAGSSTGNPHAGFSRRAHGCRGQSRAGVSQGVRPPTG